MIDVKAGIVESTGAFLVLQVEKEEFEVVKKQLAEKGYETYFLTEEKKRLKQMGTNAWVSEVTTYGFIIDGSEQIVMKTVLSVEEEPA